MIPNRPTLSLPSFLRAQIGLPRCYNLPSTPPNVIHRDSTQLNVILAGNQYVIKGVSRNDVSNLVNAVKKEREKKLERKLNDILKRHLEKINNKFSCSEYISSSNSLSPLTSQLHEETIGNNPDSIRFIFGLVDNVKYQAFNLNLKNYTLKTGNTNNPRAENFHITPYLIFSGIPTAQQNVILGNVGKKDSFSPRYYNADDGMPVNVDRLPQLDETWLLSLQEFITNENRM